MKRRDIGGPGSDGSASPIRRPTIWRPGLCLRLRTRDNDVYLSVVSAWEASIKHRLGKLPLPEPPAAYLPAQLGFTVNRALGKRRALGFAVNRALGRRKALGFTVNRSLEKRRGLGFTVNRALRQLGEATLNCESRLPQLTEAAIHGESRATFRSQ